MRLIDGDALKAKAFGRRGGLIHTADIDAIPTADMPCEGCKLEAEDFGTLAICALRYCQGRQTYMPDLVRSIIVPHLPDISNNDLNVMIEDCRFQEQTNLFGDPLIDKPGWIRWKELLIAEKHRRGSKT